MSLSRKKKITTNVNRWWCLSYFSSRTTADQINPYNKTNDYSLFFFFFLRATK